MQRVRLAMAALFVAAIPVLLVCSSVTYAFNELRLYRYGFDHYHISQRTGITDEDLMDVARQIRAYFNSASEPLDITTRVYGQPQKLFTSREVAHMRDVKRLVWGVYGLGAAAMAFLLVTVAIEVGRRRPLLRLARLALWGSGATVALVLGVGLFSLLGFDSLFLWFHQLAFSNDFWRLDPNRHFLVAMFPQSFWRDATLFVGILAVVQAVLLGALAWTFVRRATRRAENMAIADMEDRA